MRSLFAPLIAMLLSAAPAAAVVPPQQQVPQQQVPQQQAPQAEPGPLDACETDLIRSLLRDQVVPDFRGCTLDEVRALMAADQQAGQLDGPRFAVEPVLVAALGN